MNKFISMGFKRCVAVILALRCAAENASAILPGVRHALETYIAFAIIELANRIDTVWVLAAIDPAAGKQTGQFGDGDAVELALKNVINTLLQIGDGWLQPFQQSFGDLAQKDTRFAGRIKKFGIGELKSSWGSKSSIWFATAGGVKTSSLDRFARQESTSGV